MKRIFGAFLLVSVLLVSGDARALPAEGVAGPKTVSDGSSSAARLSKDGAIVTSDLTGKFYEATSRDTVFNVQTAAAGAAGTASPIGAAGSPLLAIYNPNGSGKNIEILKVNANWVSGTPAAGGILYNGACGNTITAAQNATPVSRSSPGVVSSVAKGYTATAMTGSTALSAMGLVPGANAFAGAIAATSTGTQGYDPAEGSIVVKPGCVLALAVAGAGTSPIVSADITYREAAQ